MMPMQNDDDDELKHPARLFSCFIREKCHKILLIFYLTLSMQPEPKMKIIFGFTSGREGEKKVERAGREGKDGEGERGEGKGTPLPFSCTSISVHRSGYPKPYTHAGKCWEGREFFPPDSCFFSGAQWLI